MMFLLFFIAFACPDRTEVLIVAHAARLLPSGDLVFSLFGG